MWVVPFGAAASMGILRAFPGDHGAITGASTIVTVLALLFAAVLTIKSRAAVARIQRARPGVLVVPGWASEVTRARLAAHTRSAETSATSRQGAVPGRRARGLKVAFVLTDDSLELWRVDPTSRLLAVPWAQTVGTEARAHVMGPETKTLLVIHLADGSELGMQPLEPWAGGPPRDTHDTVARGYVDHLASRVQAARERATAN